MRRRGVSRAAALMASKSASPKNSGVVMAARGDKSSRDSIERRPHLAASFALLAEEAQREIAERRRIDSSGRAGIESELELLAERHRSKRHRREACAAYRGRRRVL